MINTPPEGLNASCLEKVSGKKEIEFKKYFTVKLSSNVVEFFFYGEDHTKNIRSSNIV